MRALKEVEINHLKDVVRFMEDLRYNDAMKSLMMVSWAALPDICGLRPAKIYNLMGKAR